MLGGNMDIKEIVETMLDSASLRETLEDFLGNKISRKQLADYIEYHASDIMSDMENIEKDIGD